MKLSDRIRELHWRKQGQVPIQQETKDINELSNEELIDLISEAGDEWIDHKVRSYQTESVSVESDFDEMFKNNRHGFGLLGGNE